jgi:hypothetical protein
MGKNWGPKKTAGLAGGFQEIWCNLWMRLVFSTAGGA